MNGAHLHLALIHFPIAGLFFAAAALGWALFRKSAEARTAALVLTLLAGLSVVPAYLTGEEAEEVAEDVQGVLESTIEEHEEAAEPALIVTLLAAGIALGGLLFFRAPKEHPSWLVPVVLGFVLLAAAAIARTGNLGGHIRHPEIEMQQPPEHEEG